MKGAWVMCRDGHASGVTTFPPWRDAISREKCYYRPGIAQYLFFWPLIPGPLPWIYCLFQLYIPISRVFLLLYSSFGRCYAAVTCRLHQLKYLHSIFPIFYYKGNTHNKPSSEVYHGQKSPSILIEELGLCVGMARFELATSWSQTRRDNRATLHPELKNIWWVYWEHPINVKLIRTFAERVGSDPPNGGTV